MNGILDVNVFVGSYPFRHVPHPEPEVLVQVMKREGIAHSLVGYLPAAWHRDSTHANELLAQAVAPFPDELTAVPAINPAWPGWERSLDEAAALDAPAVRAYPGQWGIGGASPQMLALVAACAERDIALVLTTRFEDSRQRHWMDSAPDISGDVVRALVREHPAARVVLTAAGRSLIEEIHWALTPDERSRVWYDVSWIWGPPENHLAKLFRTVGAERFLYGTMWPLRLVQAPRANLELLPDDLALARLADTRLPFPRLRA